MALAVKKIEKLKPKGKIYFVIDSRGLYLAVLPSGSLSWRFRYQCEGERKQIVLGQYPDLGLAEAREKAREKRNLLAEKKDPARQRSIEGATFKEVALIWHKSQKPRWTEDHASLTLKRMEADLFPWLGKMVIGEIKPVDVLECLRRVEGRGAIEVARRLRGIASNVFQFSIAEGRDHNDPAAVQKALIQRQARNFAAITKAEAELPCL